MFGRLPGGRSPCRLGCWELFWVGASSLDDKESSLCIVVFPLCRTVHFTLRASWMCISYGTFTYCVDFMVVELVRSLAE